VMSVSVCLCVCDRGTEYCDECVCLSVCVCEALGSQCVYVCLSVIISLELHIRSSPNFLCVLPMAVAWASCGGLMILYYQELATIGDAPVSVMLITSQRANHDSVGIKLPWREYSRLFVCLCYE